MEIHSANLTGTANYNKEPEDLTGDYEVVNLKKMTEELDNFGWKVHEINSNTTMVDRGLYLVDTSSGAVSLTLPVSVGDVIVRVYNISGSNDITLLTQNGDMLQGVSTISGGDTGVHIVSTNVGYYSVYSNKAQTLDDTCRVGNVSTRDIIVEYDGNSTTVSNDGISIASPVSLATYNSSGIHFDFATGNSLDIDSTKVLIDSQANGDVGFSVESGTPVLKVGNGAEFTVVNDSLSANKRVSGEDPIDDDDYVTLGYMTNNFTSFQSVENEFTQSDLTDGVVVVTHNLGNSNAITYIVDNNKYKVVPTNIRNISENTTEITFSSVITGTYTAITNGSKS